MFLKRTSRRFCLVICFLSICDFAYAETLTDTNFNLWNGSTYISNWGTGANTTKTYGQVFSNYNSYDSIQSFSLYFKLLSGNPQSYTFSIYRISQSSHDALVPLAPNPLSTNVTPVFSTGVLVAPLSTDSFTKVTYDLGSLTLEGCSSPSCFSRSYLASISTLNIGNSDGLYALGGIPYIRDSLGNVNPLATGFNYTNQDNIELPWVRLDAAAVFELTALSN